MTYPSSKQALRLCIDLMYNFRQCNLSHARTLVNIDHVVLKKITRSPKPVGPFS